MQAFQDSDKGKDVARRQQFSWVKAGRGRGVTIDVLSDNVLLETFEFYLGQDNADEIDNRHNYDGWQTLVHVCCRWRSIVFASPRRLALKLYCTPKRSVNSKALDVWPALPIVIFSRDMKSKEDATKLIVALRRHNDRVCKIGYSTSKFYDSFLEQFATMDEPFPALTSLVLDSVQEQGIPVLPDSFLGGSAPRLRSLCLDGIPYPSIGTLLLSTSNLVRLSLCRIPHSGYIAPETIVPCLSILPRLELLGLGFRYPRPMSHRASRPPPPLTRFVFPKLTCLNFRGDIEYLEDILSQIETPMLDRSRFCFFNQLVFDTPPLGHFIRRTEMFMTIHIARVRFLSWTVVIMLFGREEAADNDRETLRLEIACKPLDWQLSALAQVLNSFLSSLPTLESLEIAVYRIDLQDEIEAVQWHELLHAFTFVKDMTLRFDSIWAVAFALEELAGERAIEVFPALRNIFVMTYDQQPSGNVKGAIAQFIATRRLYGLPVTVHYKGIKCEGVRVWGGR